MIRLGRAFAWPAACVVGLCLFAGVLAAQDAGKEGAPFPRIACVYGVFLQPDSTGGTRVAGDPLTDGEIARYDLILAVYGPWKEKASWPVLREKLSHLREANPNLVIVGRQVQVESAYARSEDAPDGLPWSKPPDDAWLADVEGKRLATPQPGCYWLNLRQPGVIEWLTKLCVEDVKERGYNGVLLGGMGPNFPDWTLSRTTPGYTADADGDGIPDELADLNFLWQDAKSQLCADVRDILGHKVVIVAGGSPQNDYIYDLFNGWATGTPLLELRRGNAQWVYEYERYVSWTEAPHKPHTTVWVSVPDSAAPPETAEVTAQRMRFGLAATLMGDGYFGFALEGKKEAWMPEFDAPLGYPCGPALGSDSGLWQREYDGGVVVVNPTAEAAACTFETPHKDVSSGTVGTEFTIQGKDGHLFVTAP